MRIRILVSDASGVVRDNLETLLEQDSIEIVGQSSDGPKTVELARTLQPDVAIVGLVLPVGDALNVAREILAASPATGVIAVETDLSERRVLTAFQAGVLGYVVRANLGDDLTRAVRDVGRGEIFLSPRASRVLVQAYL